MKLTAFDLSRANTGLYLTALDAKTLFPLCKVERVANNPEEGFQRQLDAPRVRRIAKYFQERVIPGAIVLSTTPDHPATFDEASRELTISDASGSLLVIDGQHRLYGAKLASDTAGGPNVLLPVCILTGLSLMDEVQYFIDINSTAKGVDGE